MKFLNPWYDKTNKYEYYHFEVEDKPLEVTANHKFYKVIDKRPNFLESVIAVNNDGIVVTQCVTVNGCKAELKKKQI